MRYVVHCIRKAESICRVSAGAIAISEKETSSTTQREYEFVGMEKFGSIGREGEGDEAIRDLWMMSGIRTESQRNES